jgi:hypothetical protein
MTPEEKLAYRNAKKEKLENNRDPLIVALKNLRKISITNESHTRKSNNPKQPGEWSNTEET